MERDYLLCRLQRARLISTHTLTWSVTFPLPILRWIVGISTHTLTWSVTAFSVPFPYIPLISTHTLTWSVTKLAVSGTAI